MQDVAQALANLDAYLDTWTDDQGGVHGYIVHHHRDYAAVTSPACWTQGVRILGHLSLYERTGSLVWLQKAVRGSMYLVDDYERSEHMYYDPTTPLTLINNAWPTLALLRTALAVKQRGQGDWDVLAEVAFDNLEHRILGEHWDTEAGTFFFCPPEYPAQRVHTYNMTAIAVSALCAAAKLTEDRAYLDEYARPAADHIVASQVSDGPAQGGWSYNDGRSANLFYSLYNALVCRGLLDIYESTGEERYLDSATRGGTHLARMISDETFLFSHRYVKHGRSLLRSEYPTMVAASGLALLQIRRLHVHGRATESRIEKSISRLLEHQLPHGGFQNMIGATDIWTPGLYPCEPEKRKWRDMVAVPFWNVFTFELLVDLLDQARPIIPEPDIQLPYTIETDDGLAIEEDRNHVRLSRSGRTTAYFNKKKDYMLFSTEKMRGVPFGAFANTETAALNKLTRRLRRVLAASATLLVAAGLAIAYLVFF